MPPFNRKQDGDVLFAVELNEVYSTVEAHEADITSLEQSLTNKSNKIHTHVATDIVADGTPNNTTFLRGDNTWSIPVDTTYDVATQAEVEDAASTTPRLVSGQRLSQAVAMHAPVKTADLANYSPVTHTHANYDTHLSSTANPHGVTKAQIGLSNVPNTDATSRANHTGTQTASTISDFGSAADARIAAQKAIANGLATLDAAGKIPTSQLPAIAISDVHVVATQAAQLALVVEEGDVAIRTDENKSYIHNGGTAGTMADWTELSSAAPVTSVNSKTGVVTLTTTDIAEGTNQYYTALRVTQHPDVSANTSARHTHSNKAVLDAVTASYTTAEQTKLTGIETGAQLTNATRVDAAGAVMNTDTTTAAMAFVIGENTMVSNLATKVPTQQSVKAYVDTGLAGKANSTHVHSTTDVTGLQAELDSKAAAVHSHDDRYYTETEIDTKLSTVAASGHTHDDRYYTETEVDTALSGKAASVHTHAQADVTGLPAALTERPTTTDMNAALAEKADTVHTHDDRYFTETEVNTALSGKANTSHTHNLADINATGTRSSATYLRGDGTFATPPNTTYALATQAEVEDAASTTARLVSGQRLSQAVLKHAPVKTADLATKANVTHTHVQSDITGLATEFDQRSAIARYLWHDNFAFQRAYTCVQESFDGTTWTTTPTLSAFFNTKQHQRTDVTNGTTTKGVRWTWSNVTYSYIAYIMIGFAYISPGPSRDITIDSSTDGVTWTTRASITGNTTNAAPLWIPITGYANGDTQLRLTITDATRPISISSIKGLTPRWGDQGRGPEYEVPYGWDNDRKIFVTDLRIEKPSTIGQVWAATNTSGDADWTTLTKTSVGLSNVDNTSDAAKPVSTATQTALDGKSAVGHVHDDRYYTEAEIDTKLSGTAVSGHTHDDRYYTETETNTLLAGKAASTHAHAIADVTNLQTTLDGKAPTSHTHTTAQVTGLDTALAGKASTTHTHGVADLTATGTKGTTTFLRGDNTWAVPPDTNTTYALATQAEVESATNVNARLVSGERLSQAVLKHAPVKVADLADKATHKYVQSRGENLVTNGTGLLKNNTNFSALTFDPTQRVAGNGAFKATSVYTTFTSDEIMPVDPAQTYELVGWAKTAPESVGSRWYYGIAAYDSDGISITATTHMFVAGTETKLAQPFAAGDTVMYLTSTANWIPSADRAAHQKYISIYGYTDSTGYTFPDYTYTRRSLSAQTWTVDHTAKTVTLAAAYNGAWGTIPAGTAIANGQAGGTFKYIASANSILNTTWQRFSGQVGGIDLSGQNVTNMFPPGTSGIKVLILANNQGTAPTATNTQYYADISFSNLTKKTLGLENVDNTSDANKPISTATQTALNGKAPTTHTHDDRYYTETETNTLLAGKAATSHAHAIADVTNLQTTLDGKAPTSHTHTTAQVTGLDTALAGKAPTSHTHAVGDLTATGTKSTTTFLRGDNTWATPPDTNTTYAAPSQTEAEQGIATTPRAFTAERVRQAINALSPITASGVASLQTDTTETKARVDTLDVQVATLANDVSGISNQSATMPNVPNLFLHLDATKLSLADNARVSSWTDQVVTTRNFVQSGTGAQPQFKANAINGLPAVYFDTARGDYMNMSASSGSVSATVIIVGNRYLSASNNHYLFGTNGSVKNMYATYQGNLGIQGTALIQRDALDSVPSIMVGSYGADGTSELRIDGVSYPGTTGTHSTAPTAYYVGQRSSLTAGQGFHGLIGEVMYFNRNLTSDECAQIERYLAYKWGVPTVPQKTWYIDSVYGSDTNLGRNPNQALLSFDRALKSIRVSGSTDSMIRVKAPEDAPIRSAPAGIPMAMASTIRIESTIPGTKWHAYGSQQFTTGWTAQANGVYSRAITFPYDIEQAALVTTLLDTDGQSVRVRVKNTTTPTTPAEGEYGYTGGIYYIKLPGSANPNLHTIEVASVYNLFNIYGGTKAHFKDAVVLGAQAYPVIVNGTGVNAPGFCTFTDCDFVFSAGSSGLGTSGDNVGVRAIRCRSYFNGNDGFGAHATLGITPLMELIDCEGMWNEDEGVSPHENCRLLLRGGKYHHNGDGGLTSVGGAVTQVVGTEFYQNRRTDATLTGWDSGGVSILEQSRLISNDMYVHDHPAAGIEIDTAAGAIWTDNGGTRSGTAHGNGSADIT